jgi:DnaJ-class molecular chaperone
LVIDEELSLAEALHGYSKVLNHISGETLIKLRTSNPIFQDCSLLGEGLGLPKTLSADGILTYGDLIVKLKVSYPD